MGLVASALALSCAGLLEIDGIAFGDGGGDSSTSSGGGSTGATGGGGTSSGVALDPCGNGAGVCAPMAPAGFSGPFVGSKVGADRPLPSCPDAWPNPEEDRLVTGPVQDSFNCSVCECTIPNGGDCDLGDGVVLSSGADCTSPQPIMWQPSCQLVLIGGQTSARIPEPSVEVAGTCNPIGGVPQLTDPWAEHIVLCGGAGEVNGTCDGDGSTCRPHPGEGFGLCIMTDDTTLSCPASYPVAATAFGGDNDSRDCTTCKCDPAIGETCTAQTTFYPTTNCMGMTDQEVAHDNMCEDFEFSAGSFRVSDMSIDGGMCPATGGEETGMVLGVDKRLVCCNEL